MSRRNRGKNPDAGVLSWAELRRAQQLIGGSTGEHTGNDLEQRNQTRKKRSEDRYKNWNNTLEALQERKQRERQARLQAIEDAQVELDKSEEQYKADQRRRAIERANRMLYEDTERVRQLKSSILLTKVMREREAHIARMKQRHSREEARKVQFHQMTVEQAQREIEKEKEEVEAQKQKVKRIYESQMEQKAQSEARKKLQQEEDARQAAAILERIRKEEEAALEKEKQLAAQRKEAYDKFKEENRSLEHLRQLKLKKEEEENAAVLKYAEQRAQFLDELRAKEQAAMMEKNRERNDLIASRMAALAALKEKEESKLVKDVKELKEKEEKREKDDAEYRRTMREQIDQARKEQIARKQAALERKRQQDDAMLKAWKERNDAYTQNERNRAAQKREKEMELRRFQQMQADAKNRNAREQRERDIEQAKRAVEQEQEEAAQYEKYASLLLNEFGVSENDAPVKTLKKRAGQLGKLEL